MPQTFLVTGATGYIARHIVAKLLNRGDHVVGSARSVERDAELRASIAPALTDTGALDRYRTVALDLNRDDGWAEAMQGIDVLVHTASPFPLEQPKDADEVIRPAVDGALRALRAAQASGVKRVVMTSSSVAIMEGEDKASYDETDWTPDDPALTPYARSKTLAEKAAWHFVETEAPSLRLAVVNPSFVQGAPLGDSYGTSVAVIDRLLQGKDPMLPRIGFAVCDVEDVAEAHLRAADIDEAIGHRHLIVDRFMWFSDLADCVRAVAPQAKTARRIAPNFLIRTLALFDPAIRTVVSQLGKRKEGDNRRMREVLGIHPKDARDSVRETTKWLMARD